MGKRFNRMFEIGYSQTMNVDYRYLGDYIFNIQSPINDLWSIYFILRVLIDFIVYYNWICFYSRYMKERDDF